MKNYKILKLHNEPYDFLIIATSYKNPLSLLGEIENNISVDKARLLFDLTLINGVKKNRYIKCDYESGVNSKLSYSLVKSINENIRNLSFNYFTQHEDIVQNSVLPNSLKFLLKSQLVK